MFEKPHKSSSRLVVVLCLLPTLIAPAPGGNASPALARAVTDAAPALGAFNQPGPPTTAVLEQGFGQLPLYFVENRGQSDARVVYYVLSSTTLVSFTADGVTFALAEPNAGLNTSRLYSVNCGDANADGLVNSTDALIILSYDAGLTVPFPVGQPGCPPTVTQPAGCNP